MIQQKLMQERNHPKSCSRWIFFCITVMEKLIEAYKKVNTGAEIELQTTDSTTGMTSAIDGSYDIGMASRELQDDEKDKLDSQAIATDGIAVIVNKNNTTDELSSDQVKDIYTGNAVAWDEVVK